MKYTDIDQWGFVITTSIAYVNIWSFEISIIEIGYKTSGCSFNALVTIGTSLT